MKRRFATLQPSVFSAIQFNFYGVFLKLPPTHQVLYMATNGAFTACPRLVPGAFPESGNIGTHGPGKLEQEQNPLLKLSGKITQAIMLNAPCSIAQSLTHCSLDQQLILCPLNINPYIGSSCNVEDDVTVNRRKQIYSAEGRDAIYETIGQRP